MPDQHKKVSPLLLDTYLAVIKNSSGSNLFRNLYAKVGDERQDITQNGELSCAFFVSSILVILKLIKEVHATVSGTVRDLKEFGWVEIEEPKIGAILVWEEKDFGNNRLHKHIGFYVGEGRAVSNDYKIGTPQEHKWNSEERKVELILWNDKLN
jgi:hypothetical protein